MIESKIKLGIEVKHIRESLGFTQKIIAEKLSVTPIHISYIESGKRVPSKEFLENLFRLDQNKKIPENIVKLLGEARKEVKRESYQIKPSNSIYQLKENGLYSQTSLEKLLKKEPDRLIYIIGLFNYLCEKGKREEADDLIKKSLPKIKKIEDRKWLEAYHLQLDRKEESFKKALDLMAETLAEFDKNYTNLDSELKIKKSELLFHYSLIYFDYGQFVFSRANDLNEETLNLSIYLFHEALDKHKKLRQYYMYPFSQMDYANIHYWLGLLSRYLRKLKSSANQSEIKALEEKEKSYWRNYIKELREALFYNYRESLKDFPFKAINNFYSESFLLVSYSFLAIAYARLAEFEESLKEKEELLKNGEMIFAEHTPIKVTEKNTRYRYYFNFSNFYSIKAEILDKLSIMGEKSGVEEALNFCYKGLYESFQSNKTAFINETKEEEEISFYKKHREDELNRLIKE